MKGNQSNGFLPIIAQAIAEMEETFGEFLSIEDINLAELSRRTGLSRSKLRRLKAIGFRETPHGLAGHARSRFWMGILLYWIVSCAAASAIPLSVWNVCIAWGFKVA